MKKFDKILEGILNDYENIGDDSTYDYTQTDDDQLPESIIHKLLDIKQECKNLAQLSHTQFKIDFNNLLKLYEIE